MGQDFKTLYPKITINSTIRLTYVSLKCWNYYILSYARDVGAIDFNKIPNYVKGNIEKDIRCQISDVSLRIYTETKA